MDERSYTTGYNAALLQVMREAMYQLGIESKTSDQTEWSIERAWAIESLRELCADFGDNDWDDDLNLSDIIDGHLAKHLCASKSEKVVDAKSQPTIHDFEWENIQPLHWLPILDEIPIGDFVSRIPFYGTAQRSINEIELPTSRPIISAPNPFEPSHYAMMKFRKAVEPNASKRTCWERIA